MANVDLSADGLSAVCTNRCGLFNEEAEYLIVFSARSFEPQRVTFEYARSHRKPILPKAIKQAIEKTGLSGLYITNDLANIFPQGHSSVAPLN